MWRLSGTRPRVGAGQALEGQSCTLAHVTDLLDDGGDSRYERARGLGLEVRAGLHTGEVEVVGDDVRGAAVHEAARVAAAGAGEILVSATTSHLAADPSFTFEDRGQYEFKGLAGDRTVYAVSARRPGPQSYGGS